MSETKNNLRVLFRDIRKNAKSEKKDAVIADKVLNLPLYLKADIIFVYSSVGTEIDTSEIIESSLSSGKSVALPRCMDRNGNMEFFITDYENNLKAGMFSILEPDEKRSEKAFSSENSLCIVPGLAFDKKGCRLGYGKGYYDRYLKNFKGKTVGLCYEDCLCDNLPFSEFDQKVDMIITENQIYYLEEEYIYG